jgi:hypothetical protein
MIEGMTRSEMINNKEVNFNIFIERFNYSNNYILLYILDSLL